MTNPEKDTSLKSSDNWIVDHGDIAKVPKSMIDIGGCGFKLPKDVTLHLAIRCELFCLFCLLSFSNFLSVIEGNLHLVQLSEADDSNALLLQEKLSNCL